VRSGPAVLTESGNSREEVGQCHPAGMESESFDVVVIGAGPAGENVAGRVAAGGLRTAIVERELVGGECSFWGCIPSKTLIRPGDVLAAARRVPGAAEAVTGAIDVEAALAQRTYMTNVGRLDGPQVVLVETATGSRRLHATRAVVLATGTRAAIPPIDGLADVAAWDNRAVTSTTTIPERLIVLGGGAVGVEMAQALRRLGTAQVTVLEGSDRLLAREEPFAGEQVRAAFEQEGIAVVTGARVVGAARDAAGTVTATLEDGRRFGGDEILVAVGRRPATADLGLETVGLSPGRFVEVDDRLVSSGVDGDWLFAVGDCNGRAPLTHMGKYQARIAGDVILGKDVRDEASHAAVPRVTFTDPQVCAVGITEAQAREQELDVRCVEVGTGDVAGAYVEGVGITGTSKLVVDSSRNVVVGATFTGPDVQELLHSATIAIVGAVPLDRLWHAVPSFPTVSEVWLRLLEADGL
jgi:pyruvate/2-oxoglutarate dehydrogenase complex dihydrolipoamide dehydrogenase (E3) component